MVRFNKKILRPVLLTLLSISAFGFLNTANANIETLCAGVSPCSANGEITTGVTGTLNVSWQGTVNPQNSNFPSELVSSNGGTFLVVQGQQTTAIGSTFTTLSQNVLYIIGAGDTPFSFNETVTVPASVSMAAASLGATQIVYLRQFSSPQTNSPVTGIVRFPLKPMPPQLGGGVVTPPTPNQPGGNISATTAVELLRLVLRFDDDSISRVVAREDSLRATVELNYNNGGLYVGVWEIATPASTQGEPIFVPLENVRLYLNPSRKKVLTSPELPTKDAGLYYLRFRSLQPQLSQETFQIQYFVTERGLAKQKTIMPMRTSAPAGGAWLKPFTPFRWQAVANTRAYKVEIFTSNEVPASYIEKYTAAASDARPAANDNAAPGPSIQAITGVLVPGTKTEVAMPGVAFSHLAQGQQYLWRVIAIDNVGDVIGESELQDIHTQ